MCGQVSNAPRTKTVPEPHKDDRRHTPGTPGTSVAAPWTSWPRRALCPGAGCTGPARTETGRRATTTCRAPVGAHRGQTRTPELCTALLRDTCGRTRTSPINGLHSEMPNTPAGYPDPLWAGPVPVRRRILHTEGRPIRCGETGYGLKSVVCQNSSAVGRRRGRRNIAVRRNRRGGIHGGSTATDPH